MANKNRSLVKLKCSDCHMINYYYWKKKVAEYKLNFKKFCKYCRKHTQHKEAKK